MSQSANRFIAAKLVPLAVLALGLSFGLSACKRGDETAAPAKSGVGTVTSVGMRYRCDNGWAVWAVYAAREDGKDGEPGARLELQGKTYTLYAVPTGSGAKYATENGMTPDYLMVWWTKGTEAMLIESPLDDSAGPDDERIVTTCKEAA